MNDHYDIPSMSLVMTELKNKALLYKKRRENLEKWKDVLYVMGVSKTSHKRHLFTGNSSHLSHKSCFEILSIKITSLN